MTPKIVDRDEKRLAIALTALGLFAEHGFEATSISAIADAAGVGKGTIYEYFSSKEELTVAAAAAWVGSVERQVRPLLSTSGDPPARLRALLGATTSAFLENPRVITLFLEISLLFLKNDALRERFHLIREVSGPVRAAIIEILREGAESGTFKPEAARDAERIAINLVAFVDGIGMHHVVTPGFIDLAAQVDFHLDGLLAGLLAPPQAAAEERMIP